MTFFSPQNPGIGGLDEVTDAEVLVLQNLTNLSYAQGDILYYDGSNLNRLPAGTNGQFLQTQGAGANPQWASGAGGASAIDDLSDVTITTVGNGEVLFYNSGWVNATLAEASIQAQSDSLDSISALTSSNISYVRYDGGSGTTYSLRTIVQAKIDLSLDNVENTAISTWAGSSNITTLGTVSSGDVSAILPAASLSTAGISEFASGSEINVGTDDTKSINPNRFALSKKNIRWLVFDLVAPTTDCATGTNLGGDFVSPISGTILQDDSSPFYIYATNSTAGTTGSMVVDVNINGTSIMTTNKLSFDSTEKTTTTSTTPPDLTTTSLSVGDIITIDVDSIHTTAAKGLKVYIGIREY